MHFVALFSRDEGRAQLTLIVEEQIFGVVDFLEKLGLGVKVVSNLFLLAVKSPTLLLSASVVPYGLETLTGVHVRQKLPLAVVVEVHDEVGKFFSAGHLLLELILHVLFDVAFDSVLDGRSFLLLFGHFNY